MDDYSLIDIFCMKLKSFKNIRQSFYENEKW